MGIRQSKPHQAIPILFAVASNTHVLHAQCLHLSSQSLQSLLTPVNEETITVKAVSRLYPLRLKQVEHPVHRLGLLEQLGLELLVHAVGEFAVLLGERVASRSRLTIALNLMLINERMAFGRRPRIGEVRRGIGRWRGRRRGGCRRW